MAFYVDEDRANPQHPYFCLELVTLVHCLHQQAFDVV